jgi:hypothetical protein
LAILAAAQQRAGRPQREKLPCYFYIDECQNVIRRDEKISTILDECRSQRIAMIMAHQRSAQITRTPQPTRTAPRPECIPVAYEIRHEQCRTEIYADAFPFGIERSDCGKRSFLFFPGIDG